MHGSQHFGRMRRGLPTCAMAKTYEAQSPNGVHYRKSNLDAWCRQNEAPFLPDEIARKQPLWKRAADGTQAQAVAGSTSKQRRGWHLVTILGKAEQSEGGRGARTMPASRLAQR